MFLPSKPWSLRKQHQRSALSERLLHSAYICSLSHICSHPCRPSCSHSFPYLFCNVRTCSPCRTDSPYHHFCTYSLCPLFCSRSFPCLFYNLRICNLFRSCSHLLYYRP